MTSTIALDPLNETSRVRGHLKWYSKEKGFGFFCDHETGDDVVLFQSLVMVYGRQTIAPGSWVEALCAKTNRGPQVRKMMNIVSPKISSESLAQYDQDVECNNDESVPVSAR